MWLFDGWEWGYFVLGSIALNFKWIFFLLFISFEGIRDLFFYYTKFRDKKIIKASVIGMLVKTIHPNLAPPPSESYLHPGC